MPTLVAAMTTNVPKNSGHAAAGFRNAAAPRYTSPEAARIGARSPPLGVSSAMKLAMPMPTKVGHQLNERHSVGEDVMRPSDERGLAIRRRQKGSVIPTRAFSSGLAFQ
jgi:hypothetical protein